MITYDKGEMRTQIVNFLKNHDLAVISTINSENKPEAATIGYFIDDDLSLYLITREDSRKAENIAGNPNVALVIGTTAGPNTVQIEGSAQILKSGDKEFADLLVKFAALKVLYYGPFLKMEGINFIICKVTISWLRFLDVNDATNKEEFYQLIPDQSSQ